MFSQCWKPCPWAKNCWNQMTFWKAVSHPPWTCWDHGVWTFSVVATSQVTSGKHTLELLKIAENDSWFTYEGWWFSIAKCKRWPEWNLHFPMVFPWFSHFSIVFLWLTYECRISEDSVKTCPFSIVTSCTVRRTWNPPWAKTRNGVAWLEMVAEVAPG